MAYERCVIEDWFGFHSSDPNTGAELETKKQLAPINVVPQKLIARWVDDEKKGFATV